MTTFVTSRVAGALASMPNSLIGLVLDYYLSFEMSYCSHRLEFAGNEPIQGTQAALAMRTSDGSVVSWGVFEIRGSEPHEAPDDASSLVPANLKDVKALCGAREGAFAAIAGEDNQVICWGAQGN